MCKYYNLKRTYINNNIIKIFNDMVSGYTKDNTVLWGVTDGDLNGKIEYYNHINYFLSGYTEEDALFTENQYAKVDVEYKGNERVDELKYRDIPASRYLNEGYIYEKKKWDYMKNFNKPYYICFFQDVVIVWDVSKVNLHFYLKECASNTQFGGYDKKEMKYVSNLQFDDAHTIFYRKGNKYIPLNNKQRERCKEWLKENRKSLMN